MKTLSVLLIAFILLAACKKVPSPGSALPSLVGLWELHSQPTYESINGAAQSPQYYEVDSSVGDYIAFDRDGTGSISVPVGAQFQITNFSYTKSGQNLTLYESEIIKHDTLLKLTHNSLIIRDVVLTSDSSGNKKTVTDTDYER